MSRVTDAIRQVGHWDAAIRPEVFDPERVPYSDLLETVVSATVRLRGWPVPMLSNRDDVLRHGDWIGQDVDATAVKHLEAWRFFTSGQFSQLRAFSADMERDISTSRYEGPVIQVWEILFYLSELFELAARLALSALDDERIIVTASLNRMESRQLIIADERLMDFPRPLRTQAEQLEQTSVVQKDELIANPAEHAVEMTWAFTNRFGADLSLDQLRNYQRRLLDRGRGFGD